MGGGLLPRGWIPYLLYDHSFFLAADSLAMDGLIPMPIDLPISHSFSGKPSIQFCRSYLIPDGLSFLLSRVCYSDEFRPSLRSFIPK